MKIVSSWRKRILTMLLLAGFLTSNLFAYDADVQNISSGKYFESTLHEINSAKFSIIAVLYLVSAYPEPSDSQPNQLLNALIKAKDRGVSVKVILDQQIDFDNEPTDDAAQSNKNQTAFEILKNNQVPVFFDTSDVYTHSKAILIDNETVILGSSNWSTSALSRNNEANVLIKSKELAKELLSDFDKIKLKGDIPASLTPAV